MKVLCIKTFKQRTYGKTDYITSFIEGKEYRLLDLDTTRVSFVLDADGYKHIFEPIEFLAHFKENRKVTVK